MAGRTVLFSGDSSWTDQFITHSRGADLFICECCHYDLPSPSHMSYMEIAAHRERLECKRLILTHMGEEMLARRRSLPVSTADGRDGVGDLRSGGACRVTPILVLEGADAPHP